jgi:transposase
METTGIFHFDVAWRLEVTFPDTDVAVMNARLIHRFITGIRKNDRSDAQKLAIIARYPELVRYSYVPDQNQAALRELTRMRVSCVRETTRIKNRIKKILSMFGFHWSFSYDHNGHINFLLGFLRSNYPLGRFLELCRKTTVFSDMKRYFDELDKYNEINLPAATRHLLIFCFHSLRIHQEEIHLVEKQIYQLIDQMPQIKNSLTLIESMPGMQSMSKISLLAELGSISRFPTAGDVAVYAGIAPRGGTSGIKKEKDTHEKQVVQDRPNRKCNRILKTLFVRCAGVIFRMSAQNKDSDDICRYASRFPDRKKLYFKKAFKVAAKWIRKMFFCLTHRRPYDPLVGLDKTVHAKKKSRNYRLRKKTREFYERNRAMKHKLAHIYDRLKQLGVAPEVIQQLQTEYGILPQGGGIKHG